MPIAQLSETADDFQTASTGAFSSTERSTVIINPSPRRAVSDADHSSLDPRLATACAFLRAHGLICGGRTTAGDIHGALKIAIAGVGGRMGRTLVRLVQENADARLVAGIEGAGSPVLGLDIGTLAGNRPVRNRATSDALEAVRQADALIDSRPLPLRSP